MLAFSLYATAFICRTSSVIDGVRYFSLFDDAMISMRYARNFAAGHGLIWNPGGARVEGYTNLGWVLFMALWHCTAIDPAKVSLGIQVSSAVFLLLNLVAVHRLARLYSGGDPLTTVAASAMTAFYFPLVNWSLQGTEVGVLTLLMSAAVLYGLESLEGGVCSARPYVLLGFASLIRIDFLIPLATLLAFFAVAGGAQRTKHLWVGGLVLCVSAVAQTAFRALYYGDILPNTYYLKVTGVALSVRLAMGAWLLARFVFQMNWVLFLVPFLALTWRRDRPTRLLLWMVVTQLAYSVYVGGDAWDESWGGSNRFITPVMPLFFVVFCDAVVRGAGWLRQRWKDGPAPSPGVVPSRTVVVLFLAACLLTFNALNGPKGLAWLTLVRPPPDVDSNARNIRLALAVRNITSDDATVAVVWAGAIPYFANRTAIDFLGKNDPVIAHMRANLPGGLRRFLKFHPGHNKWDLQHSIGTLKPDLIAQLWWDLPPSLAPEYRKIHPGSLEMYARRGSQRVLWNQLERVAE